MERIPTTYSTMPEPIMAHGCTRKFLAWIILWSLWAWVANHRMIRRVLRDILGQHWILQVPWKPLGTPGCLNQSTQMCIKVATLSLTINYNSHIFHGSSARQVTLWSYLFLRSFIALDQSSNNCMVRIWLACGFCEVDEVAPIHLFIIKPLGVTSTLLILLCYACRRGLGLSEFP